MIHTGSVGPPNQKEHRDDSVVGAVDDELQRKPSVILDNTFFIKRLHATASDDHQVSPHHYISVSSERKLMLLTVHSWFGVSETHLCHNVQPQRSFVHDHERNDGLQGKGHKSVDPESQSVALHGEVGCYLKPEKTKCL